MEEDPEDRMFEYLLVFNIPKGRFFDQSISLNEFIQKKFNLVGEKKYHPHLTALLACLHDSNEKQFIQFIREVADTIAPFDVTPSSIEGFDYNTVVYVDMEDKKPMKAIIKKLKDKLKRIVKPYNSLKHHRTFEPRYTRDLHVTIWKHLDKILYDYLLTTLKSENHTFENFRIEQMILFKKPLGSYKNQKIAVFKFLGKTEGDYIQGSLFDQLER